MLSSVKIHILLKYSFAIFDLLFSVNNHTPDPNPNLNPNSNTNSNLIDLHGK